MPDAAVRTRTDTEHGRYDRLVAEVLRLRCELDRRAEASAIDLLARATTAEAQLAEARDDLAISEAANEALRAAVAAVTAQARKAEAECETLRARIEVLADRLAEAEAGRDRAERSAWSADDRATAAERERGEALARLDRPSHSCWAGQVAGAAIGAFIACAGIGVEIARSWW